MDTIEDLEALLANILDDTKPLPVQPTPAQTIINTQVNAGHNPGHVAMDNPDDFLESLLNEPELPALGTPEFGPAVQAEMDAKGITLPELVEAAKQAKATNQVIFAGATGVTQCVTIDDPERVISIPGLEEEPGIVAAEVQASSAAAIFTDTDVRENKIASIKMPVFTASDFAETMDIRNFATLVTLNTARWHAKAKDRQASKDAATMNEADENSFETRKRLLVGADTLLKKIHKAIDEARAAHYEMTLPWTTTSMSDNGRRTGGRLLPNTLFVEYTTVMAAKKKAMLAALDAFEPEYPNLVEIARKKLGKRFDQREYPNVSSIRTHFDLSFDFQPIPKGDDFKGLPQAQLDALASKINDNTQKRAELAMQDVWVRLHEAVGRMAERLSSPDKLFHGTLVQNVRDTARLLAHLNVTGDAKVESLRQKVEKYLCTHEASVLRENQTIRRTTAAHAQSIIEEMGQ